MPFGVKTLFKFARNTVKYFSPTAIKAAFWGSIAYFGPVAVVSTLGPGPLLGTFAFVHFGGPELLTSIM